MKKTLLVLLTLLFLCLTLNAFAAGQDMDSEEFEEIWP